MRAATTLDGRLRAQAVLTQVREASEAFAKERGRPVGLAFVTVGDDGAQDAYLRGQERAAAQAAFFSETHRLPISIGTGALARFVRRLGQDERIDGILLGLPLPQGLDEAAVLEEMDPQKDVDGQSPLAQGRLLAGLPGLRPATALGILDLLRAYDVPLQGRQAAVLGRSGVVGKPVALLLLEADATVTVLHSKSPDVAAAVRGADIVVAAVGKPRFVTKDMVRAGAAVVDVGIHATPDGLVGDVHPDVAQVAGARTPGPGGVGPMTSAMLMRQTMEAALCRS